MRHELNSDDLPPAATPSTMMVVHKAAHANNKRILGSDHLLNSRCPPNSLPSYSAMPPKAGLVMHMHAAFVPK